MRHLHLVLTMQLVSCCASVIEQRKYILKVTDKFTIVSYAVKRRYKKIESI